MIRVEQDVPRTVMGFAALNPSRRATRERTAPISVKAQPVRYAAVALGASASLPHSGVAPEFAQIIVSAGLEPRSTSVHACLGAYLKFWDRPLDPWKNDIGFVFLFALKVRPRLRVVRVRYPLSGLSADLRLEK
jgi:hypothetical protein